MYEHIIQDAFGQGGVIVSHCGRPAESVVPSAQSLTAVSYTETRSGQSLNE